AAAEDLLDERNSGFLSQQSLQTDKNLFGRAVRRGSSRQRPARGTFGTRRRRECDALGGRQRGLHIRETDLPYASCKSHLFFDHVQARAAFIELLDEPQIVRRFAHRLQFVGELIQGFELLRLRSAAPYQRRQLGAEQSQVAMRLQYPPHLLRIAEGAQQTEARFEVRSDLRVFGKRRIESLYTIAGLIEHLRRQLRAGAEGRRLPRIGLRRRRRNPALARICRRSLQTLFDFSREPRGQVGDDHTQRARLEGIPVRQQ